MNISHKSHEEWAQAVVSGFVRQLPKIAKEISRVGEHFAEVLSGLRGPRNAGSSYPDNAGSYGRQSWSSERTSRSSQSRRESFMQADSSSRDRESPVNVRRRACSEPAIQASGTWEQVGPTLPPRPNQGLKRANSDPGPNSRRYASDLRKMGSFNNSASDLAPKILADVLGAKIKTTTFTPDGVNEAQFLPEHGASKEININNKIVEDGAGKESPHWDPSNSDVPRDGDCLYASVLEEMGVPSDKEHIQELRNKVANHLEEDLKSPNSKYALFIE